MAIGSRGAMMAVDWEQRVDFGRLRRERLGRAKVVTPTGPQFLIRFPADELLVTGATYTRGADLHEGRVVAID